MFSQVQLSENHHHQLLCPLLLAGQGAPRADHGDRRRQAVGGPVPPQDRQQLFIGFTMFLLFHLDTTQRHHIQQIVWL